MQNGADLRGGHRWIKVSEGLLSSFLGKGSDPEYPLWFEDRHGFAHCLVAGGKEFIPKFSGKLVRGEIARSFFHEHERTVVGYKESTEEVLRGFELSSSK